MGLEPSSSRIGVVGTGVIGASWAACFLAKGFDVAASDPAEGAEKRLRTLVDRFWPALEGLGLVEGALRSRLHFDRDLTRAVAGCAFVQESGPESVDVKRDLLARISAAVPADSLIATSSSGIPIRDIQDAATSPERVLLGHPFNPPHLMPLVEVAGGGRTSEVSIDRAPAFYRRSARRPYESSVKSRGTSPIVVRPLCGARPSTWWSRGSRRSKISTRRLRRVRDSVGRCAAPFSICSCPRAPAVSPMCSTIWCRRWKTGGATWAMSSSAKICVRLLRKASRRKCA